MTKRLLLLLACLLLASSAMAESAPLYTGQLRTSAPLFASPDGKSEQTAMLSAGSRVKILEVWPGWLLVRDKAARTGYVQRSRMSDTSVLPLNPTATPAYSTVPCGFLAWVSDQAAVREEPDEQAAKLTLLRQGARLALIDIQDGWARVIFHRQYGYINTNQLSEILPFNLAEASGDDAPIAAYTSFYKTTSDGSNFNRIVNLNVACERMAQQRLLEGDRLDFNRQIGPFSRRNGYLAANVLVKGEIVQGFGGGTCQVSSTLYNVVLQLPGIGVVYRRAHGPAAASYLPHGADAAVGSDTQNFIIQNHYPYPLRIDGSVQDGALTIAIYRAD
jgi:uncharacterized protein YgiM (DUF1202 family)